MRGQEKQLWLCGSWWHELPISGRFHLAMRSPALSSDPSGSTWCSVPAAGDSSGMNIFITCAGGATCHQLLNIRKHGSARNQGTPHHGPARLAAAPHLSTSLEIFSLELSW